MSAPACSPASHPHLSLCNCQIFCSIFWPPSLGGKETAHLLIFLLQSCSHLLPPSAETIPRISTSLGECCAVRAAYSQQRWCGGGRSELPDACSEVKLLWLCLNILAGCISGAPQRNRTGTYSAASVADNGVSHQRTQTVAAGQAAIYWNCVSQQRIMQISCFVVSWNVATNYKRLRKRTNQEPKLCVHITDVSSKHSVSPERVTKYKIGNEVRSSVFLLQQKSTNVLDVNPDYCCNQKSNLSTFMRLHVSSSDFWHFSLFETELLPNCLNAFSLNLEQSRLVPGVEAFLIKHVQQQQTLDLYTSEGRWLQKQQNKHICCDVWGPLSSIAGGLMSESAASQILLHFITYVGGSLLLGTTCFVPISHSCLITFSFSSLFPPSCRRQHWAVINIVIFNWGI